MITQEMIDTLALTFTPDHISANDQSIVCRVKDVDRVGVIIERDGVVQLYHRYDNWKIMIEPHIVALLLTALDLVGEHE